MGSKEMKGGEKCLLTVFSVPALYSSYRISTGAACADMRGWLLGLLMMDVAGWGYRYRGVGLAFAWTWIIDRVEV